MPTIRIVPLGPVNQRLNLPQLVRRMNRCQGEYLFHLEAGLMDVPTPNRIGLSTSVPQYDPEDLALYVMRSSPRAKHDREPVIAVIDAELFDGLNSVCSADNRCILISLREKWVPSVIRGSGRGLEQYAELELGLQLLTAEYRLEVGSNVDPQVCGAPWHAERRGCAFDYYGLNDHSYAKLLNPTLCARSSQDFATVGIQPERLAAGWAIVRNSRLIGPALRIRAATRDPVVGVLAGGLIGLVTALIASNVALITGAVVLAALIVLRALRLDAK